MKELKRKVEEKGIRKEKIRGITMVALVVTIIILLILSGITVSLLFGNNGIITRASNAKKTYEISSIKEEIQMKILDKEMEKTKTGEKITQLDVEKILIEYGEVNKNEDGTIKNLITKDKNYEIPYEEIYNSKLAQEEGSESSGGNNTGDLTISREEYNRLIERLDALDGGVKSSLTLDDRFEAVNSKINNIKEPQFNRINIREGYTSSSDLINTGVSVTIPANSYYSITVMLGWHNGRPIQIALGSSETVNNGNMFGSSSQEGNGIPICSKNGFTQGNEQTFYIWAKNSSIGNGTVIIEGYYIQNI